MIYGINLFYFSSNHPSRRFNQDISPTSYSNDSNHSVNTHFFLLPYYKWNLYVCQVGFKNFVYSKRSGGSSGVMSLSNHARGITIDPHIQESLAECIETPYILKVPYFGVSTCGELGRTIQILQEDAKFTRRPDITLYRNP